MKRPASAGFKRLLVKKPAALALAGKKPAALALARRCSQCGKKYEGSCLKNVSYSLRRHMRDAHGIRRASMQSKEDRLLAQRKYKISAFRVEPALAGAAGAEAFVVCPKEREDALQMFSDTRKHLIESGFSKSEVHRLMGVDCDVIPRGWSEDDLKKHRFLGKYFATTFKSAALAAFAGGADTVYWVEDDCRLLKDVSAKDLSTATRKVSPAACWMGYYGRPPRWGAHLIGFTKASFKAFMPRFTEKHHSTKMAIDTIFQIFAKEEPTLLKATPLPFAKQRPHKLKGRKVSISSR